MARRSEEPAKREPLNIRIKPKERNLIDRAERPKKQIAVTPHAYAALLKKLDAPARLNARLRKTMATEPPWKEA
jgi:uncharacterized protein (DUF1778 family)